MRPLGKFLVVMLTVLSLGGCQAMTGRTAGENVDDSTTTASVKTKLAGDKVSSLTRVDVDTTNGVVSLNGVVESAEQRARIEELAREVKGVRSVKNNLQVQKK
jgi:hyperosmotically inducible periplasmic protein